MESVGMVIRPPLGMSVHIAAQHAGWGFANPSSRHAVLTLLGITQ
jgi:hypothetical protein